MKTKETKKYENLSETTRQVFLSYRLLFPFSFHFGNITTTVKGLHFPSCSFDFPFLPYRLNSARLITMGHEIKQQTMKPSSSAPVTTHTKQPQPDISLSTPTKKTTPLINTRPVSTKDNSLKQKKVQKKEEDEEEVPKIRLTLSEKRERQAQRVHQLKKWRVREEREAREVRLQQRKKLLRGESKEIVVEEETIKKKCVRFNLKKNKIIQIIEGV